jgi:putative Holliday junction resolvase
MGRVLGFDFGDRRLGVAGAHDEIGVATGLSTIAYDGRKDLRHQVGRLMEEQRPERLIVGNPLNLNGSVGERSAAATRFAEQLRSWFGLPVELWDERLTSAQADRIRVEAGTSTAQARRGGMIDRAAAVLILQSWLDGRQDIESPADAMDDSTVTGKEKDPE